MSNVLQWAKPAAGAGLGTSDPETSGVSASLSCSGSPRVAEIRPGSTEV